MRIFVDQLRVNSGIAAAKKGADCIHTALHARGEAEIILATGASQFDMLEAIVARQDIDWSKVSVFHLDEYVGLARSHPASFVNYLTERFVSRAVGLRHFEAINGAAQDPMAEIRRLNARLATASIDVAFIGIGENGHLAFNDPPADFETNTPFLKVTLDQACRNQQVSEGWFDTLENVPKEAISMSIPQILKSQNIICTVPDARKAEAVHGAVEGPYDNRCPASALQKHSNTWLFLDAPAETKLSKAYSNV